MISVVGSADSILSCPAIALATADAIFFFPFYLSLCNLWNLWFRLFLPNKPNFFTTKYALSISKTQK